MPTHAVLYLLGPSGSQPPAQDNGLESSHIPKAYSRWQEESIALDGQSSHLCMRALRDTLIQRLVEAYKQDNASKDSADAAKTKTSQAPVETGSTTQTTTATVVLPTTPGVQVGERTVPVAPHPSDQVTPSSHSPREGGSTVDQLRSSLRQVADALAQTVAAVRTTREQLLGGREEEGGGADVSEREEGMEESTVLSSPPPPPLGGHPPPPPPLSSGSPRSTAMTQPTAVDRPPLMAASVSPPAPPPLVTTPITQPAMLSTFNGSQESAAATLASTDPSDPLHTFLSAMVGAPAPPLPGSGSTISSQASPLSGTGSVLSSLATPLSGTGSILSSLAASLSGTGSVLSSLATPLSGTGSVLSTDTSATYTAVTTPTTATPILTTSPRLPVFTQLQQSDSDSAQLQSSAHAPSAIPVIQEGMELVPAADSSLAVPPGTVAVPPGTTPSTVAGNFASQMSLFFTQNQTQEMDARTRSAHLAEELARVMSQLVPTSASSSSAYSSLSLQAPPSSGGLTNSAGEMVAGQSPSPSDTLAPLLMSSLQMPSSIATPQQSTESVSTMVTGTLTPLLDTLMQGSPQSPSSPRTTGTSPRSIGALSTPRTTGTSPRSIGAPRSPRTSGTSPRTAGAPRSPRTTGTSPVSAASRATSTPAQRMMAVLAPSGTVEVPVTSSSTPRLSPAVGTAPTTPPTTTQHEGGASVQATHSLSHIDPGFLAALPDGIRQEVMAQHEREQRLLRAQQEANFMSTISPEFLAALPPNIQEEVSPVPTMCSA